MSVPQPKRPNNVESENGRLKKLLAEQLLENEAIKETRRKNDERTGTSWRAI